MARHLHPTNESAGAQGSIRELKGRQILEARPEIMRMVDSVSRIVGKAAAPRELLMATSEWIATVRRMNAEEADLYGIEHTAALFGKVNTAFEVESRRNQAGIANQLCAARDALWDLLCNMKEGGPRQDWDAA